MEFTQGVRFDTLGLMPEMLRALHLGQKPEAVKANARCEFHKSVSLAVSILIGS